MCSATEASLWYPRRATPPIGSSHRIIRAPSIPRHCDYMSHGLTSSIGVTSIARGVDHPRGSLSDASGTPVSQSSHAFLCCISQQVDENSILRPVFSPGVHTDSSFAKERPQSSRYSFWAKPALTGFGSEERAFAFRPVSNTNIKAIEASDTAIRLCLKVTISPRRLQRPPLPPDSPQVVSDRPNPPD
jgi:hypothetical protein